MDNGNIQVAFFQHLKAQLPSHISIVEELADLLNISTDSAYRRLRGEKPISFDELQVICLKYRISLDQMFLLQSDSLVFTGKSAGNKNFDFLAYLQSVAGQLHFMNSFDKREMYFLNKDIPLFYHFNYPHLSAFKCYFWMRTILNDPQFNNQPFSFDQISNEIIAAGKKIFEAYSQLPSTEVWNIESVNSSIRQIEYYKDSKLFRSANDIAIIYDELLESIGLIESQAELGYKTSADGKVHYRHIPYRIYVNEFVLGDNTILARLGDISVTFLVHSVFNYLHTRDKEFNELTYRHFQNIIRKSTLISDSGEKDRRRFFNLIREKINARKNAIL